MLRNPSLARLVVGLLTLPWASTALAQSTTTPKSGGKPLFDTIEQVIAWSCKVVDVLFTFAVIVTIVFVLLAAIQYITGGADPAKVKNAHQKLIWAAIGFAVALISATVPDIVAIALGTTLPAAC